MLLGENAMARLASSHVAVFGIGGVGSWCAEALARAGVGEITLVDNDTIAETNINRQIGALYSTLGQPKVFVMAERLSDINPDLKVHPVYATYSAENREEFFVALYDYIVDAVDLVSSKVDLIETTLNHGIPIISSMGTGNKLDPSLFEITDISKTRVCPLAKVMRRELKRRGILNHRVLYSPEPVIEPLLSGEPFPPGRRSIPGSVSWVPSSVGLLLAGDVVMKLTTPPKM